MSLREALILRKQFRKKADELSLEKQKSKKLTDEVLRLNGAVCTAMAQLSTEDMAKFHMIVEKEAYVFARKRGWI